MVAAVIENGICLKNIIDNSLCALCPLWLNKNVYSVAREKIESPSRFRE